MCGISICLLTCAVCDLKSRTLPVWILIIAQLCSLIVFLRQEYTGYFDGVLGGVIGVCLFLLSRITREAVGYGDSWLVLILGLAFGARTTLWILAIASLVCALVSFFFLIGGKGKKDTLLPFVPFLLLGYLGVMMI